jgi:hypothetical protein
LHVTDVPLVEHYSIETPVSLGYDDHTVDYAKLYTTHEMNTENKLMVKKHIVLKEGR